MQVSGIVEVCGGERYFLRSVGEALKLSEREETCVLLLELRDTAVGEDRLTSLFQSTSVNKRV